MTFGQQISLLADSRQWSLRELARRSGLSPGFLHKLYHDMSEPTLSTLTKLASAFEIPLCALVANLTEAPIPANAVDFEPLPYEVLP